MGCQRTDFGCTKWWRRGDRKSAGRTRRPSTFECTWYSCTHTVSAVSTGMSCPFGSFLSDRWRQPDFEDRKRARQKLPSLMTENGNACTTCAYLSPTPGFFSPLCYCQCLCPYGQRCSDTNDGLFERRVVSVYNVYLHILCMIEPSKGMRFSSSVKHLHNMHLSALSLQIQIRTTNTSKRLLIVT